MKHLLSPRLWMIAELAGSGYADKEISAIANITEGTVKAHMTRIYDRLDIRGWGNSRSRLTRMVVAQQCEERSMAGL